MPLLVLLWLALLGFAPSASSAPSAVDAVAAALVRGAGADHARPERHPAPEAVRAPAVANLVAARLVTHFAPRAAGQHAPPFALVAAAIRRRDDADADARRALARELSHVLAARGAHLPYFPTAPPLQG